MDKGPVERFRRAGQQKQVQVERDSERMSFNPKPLQVSSVDGQPEAPPVKVTTQPTPQIPPTANNLHVLATGGGERLAQLHLQQQMASFQSQAHLFQSPAVATTSSEPLALTRVVTDKQANGNVSIVPQIHTTSLKLTYAMQHKPAASQPPAHMSSQPTSVQQQHHASVATASQAQVQHTPQQQPPAGQQKVPSPQKAAPPPQTRAPVAVATTTAAQSQLQANNNVQKAPSPQQGPTTPQKSAQSVAQGSKLATVVTPSKTTMKLATVTTPRIKQTARKNQAALTRPQINFAAAEAAAATSRPSTSSPAAPETPTKASVAKAAPPVTPEKEKEKDTPKESPPQKKEKPAPAAKTPKQSSGLSSGQDSTDAVSTSSQQRFKRSRTRTIPYQSPLPEYAMLTKLSYAESSSSGSKSGEDKLVLFYKSEFMAVRNAEGGFFLCQAQHNVYKSSPRIKIQWLSEEKPSSPMYIPDFYDITDLECVLTSVELEKKAKKLYQLPEKELERIQNILKKAIDVEKGILPRPDVTEENPDGLDLSLYKDESQLERGSAKKRGSSASNTPKRTKRTKVDDETPKRQSTRTTSPRKNFAESDFELSDEEEPLKITPRVGRPPKQTPTPTAKVVPAKKTPTATPLKTPVKSKTTPQKPVVFVKEPVARGRKRKVVEEEEDPLALPPVKKSTVQTPLNTPAAATSGKASPVKKSQITPVAQSTKKTPVKGKKVEAVPESAKKAAVSPPQPLKISPKAKVAKAQDKESAGSRTTRARK